jgi:hypothetical protein
MIKIEKKERNTIYYACDCGAKGRCFFKPLDRDAAIVLDIKCPACEETERITLLQYSSEENKKKILKNLQNFDMSWVPSMNEEILNSNEE